MKKKLLLLAVAVLFVSFFISAGLFADSTPQDIINMESKAYTEHKKGICEFPHKKHAEDLKLECGTCHHDDKGAALELKAGDDVQKCIECHNKPGEKPKGKDAPKLTPKQKREYHADMMHAQCKGCHKDYNKENKTKAAPATCKGCHPKTN
ncbi:MAG: cytochrome c3 family protein [Deltaproteobacteria bacterium]|nr:cytochrome c3 family protein [Deltaproteobacteria bacterium]